MYWCEREGQSYWWVREEDREMANGAARVLRPPRPTITLPPRSSVENLFAGVPGLSPGPLTLVSNFFSDNYPDSDCCSFSQLLAVAMTSPVAPKVQSLLAENVSREVKLDTGGEHNSGFKQNCPVNLVVAHSPVFMIPPGLSPPGLLNSPGFFSPLQSPFGMTHQQALAQVTAEAELSKRFMHIQAEHQSSSLAPSADCLTHHQPLDSETTVQQELPTSVQEPESSLMESIELSQYDMKSLPPATVDKPVSDGYNWRKYGQKQVKASEYPRSYYRCTHPNCPVKKKVERNNAGLISEITYKGQHSHGLQQSNKRTKKAATDVNSNTISQITPEVGLLGETEMHMTGETFHHPVPGWDQASTQLTPTQLSRSSDHEEMSDTEVKLDEGEIGEPSPKRRFTAIGTSELTSSQRTVTEHRIVLQTKSEVDILNDGYKWRKYGQKVVKGKSHPRSYYKCSNAGCTVRKHVERASTDPEIVVTTYEGKHNHDVPAARKSSHNTANSNTLPVKPLAEMGFGNKDQRPILLQLKE